MSVFVDVVCGYSCARQFSLEHLLEVIFFVLVSEVYSVLTVQKAIYVEFVFDVECLSDLAIPADFVVEAVAVLAHYSKYSRLLGVQGKAMDLK